MNPPRVPLFQRLPAIYRIRDDEQAPPGQLASYLAVVEQAFSAIHENIESLYNDLFIDTCDDWVVPYLADLLGTSHLKGLPWTIRADVADTIALRRRKGTLGAIELLAFDLTEWAAHCVELRENLVWNQHLNHQRRDAGGKPPYGGIDIDRFAPRRGGTLPVRSPASLSLLGTPFDPFAHVADVKPATVVGIHYNLPNLAIFLWRLVPYRLPVSRPLSKGFTQLFPGAPPPNLAKYAIRFDLHPLDRPVQLFNTYRFDENQDPPVLSKIDEVPGPIPPARLNSDSPAGNPGAYVAFDIYDPTNFTMDDLNQFDAGLEFYLPQPQFAANWNLYVHGDNLCAWETGLRQPLRNREIVIDPVLGRVLFGVANAPQRDALIADLWVNYTYAAVGSVGAYPISRDAPPTDIDGAPTLLRPVTAFPASPAAINGALDNLQTVTQPVVVEIQDSLVHELDLNAVAGTLVEDGGPNLVLQKPLILRAADGHRPIVRLAQPLRFRLADPNAPLVDQARLLVRLEGIYLTRGPTFPAGEPLIARAAVGRLELIGCTLDPGGFRQRDGTRAPLQTGLRLRQPYGFANPADETKFKPVPHVLLQRTISGAALIDEGYRLVLSDSILDAGAGVDDPAGTLFALTNATDSVNGWGPPTDVRGATFFGRTRVEQMNGTGGIWVHQLEVHNNQTGCIKFSYFSGENDRLPPHFGCVSGPEAKLKFTSEWFEQPGYAQLGLTSDKSILQFGPRYPNSHTIDDRFPPADLAVPDAMGAFGFLLEAHKWINLQIRFREFMPVGVRPLLIPVT
jgi:hypothetical protein